MPTMTFQLSDKAAEQLKQISTDAQVSHIDVVRLGISLVGLLVKATKQGNELIICSPNGFPLTEIFIPDEYKTAGAESNNAVVLV